MSRPIADSDKEQPSCPDCGHLFVHARSQAWHVSAAPSRDLYWCPNEKCTAFGLMREVVVAETERGLPNGFGKAAVV
jgi:hypothetical protein